MYGSSFWSVTRKPRLLSSRPSDDAVSPLPRLDATPPVTKTCLANAHAPSEDADTAMATVAPACAIFGDQRPLSSRAAGSHSSRSAAAELVEPTEHRNPLDDTAERDQLARDRERDEDREHDGPNPRTALEHDREAEHRADHVRAGVTQHQSLAQVVAQQSGERAHDRRDRDTDAVRARDQRERH